MKSLASYRVTLALLLALLGPIAAAGCGRTAVLGDKNTSATENPAVSVTQKVGPSIVSVVTRGEQRPRGEQNEEEPNESVGSGVVFRSDGYIITNAHVVEAGGEITITFSNGDELKAEVIGQDKFSDIAILKVDKDDLPVPSYGKSKDVKIGQTAITIGNPFGFENTVTEGIVSATRRSIPGGAPSLTNMIQTDAAISPGNSGGALVNTSAQVIGITTAFIPPQSGAVSLGFAIPVDVVTRVGNQLIDKGKATHAFLGLSPETLTQEDAKRLGVPVTEGALTKEVVAGGPADKAGLEKDDVIVKMDGLPIKTADDVFGVVNGHAPGDEVIIEFYRKADKNSVTAKLGERTE